MRKVSLSLGLTLLAALFSLSVAAQSLVPVELKTQVDTKAAKVGDKLTAVTTVDLKNGGKVVLPKGSKLTGEVDAVTASAAKNTPATLSITFSQAVKPKGQTVALRGGIASVASGGSDDSEYSAFEVSISPAAGGGTQLTDPEGNFKLENGRRVQLSLSTASGAALGTADKP